MIYSIRHLSSFSDESLINTFSLLSENQQRYVDGKPAEKRKQSLAVRCLLCEFLGIDAVKEISFSENGHPNMLGCGKFFSFSHSGEFVSVAISDKPIGIDIQVHRNVSNRMFEKVFGNVEVSIKDNANFFKLWTFKEACVKCFDVTFAIAKNIGLENSCAVYKGKKATVKQLFTDEYTCSIVFCE